MQYLPRVRGNVVQKHSAYSWEMFITVGPDDVDVQPICMCSQTPFISHEAALADLKRTAADVVRLSAEACGLQGCDGVIDMKHGATMSFDEFTKAGTPGGSKQ